MHYAYIANDEDQITADEAQLKSAIDDAQILIADFVADPESNKVAWDRRSLNTLLTKTCKAGDTIVTFEAGNLARSALQVIEILEFAAKHNVHISFLKYQMTFTPDTDPNTLAFLKLMHHIESDFVTQRTKDALARRRAAGLPLGRPKGRKNKSRKLDKHSADIKRYLALNISKASIAKLVGCHAQTLYNYIEDRDLVTEVESERAQGVDHRQAAASSEA